MVLEQGWHVFNDELPELLHLSLVNIESFLDLRDVVLAPFECPVKHNRVKLLLLKFFDCLLLLLDHHVRFLKAVFHNLNSFSKVSVFNKNLVEVGLHLVYLLVQSGVLLVIVFVVHGQGLQVTDLVVGLVFFQFVCYSVDSVDSQLVCFVFSVRFLKIIPDAVDHRLMRPMLVLDTRLVARVISLELVVVLLQIF